MLLFDRGNAVLEELLQKAGVVLSLSEIRILHDRSVERYRGLDSNDLKLVTIK